MISIKEFNKLYNTDVYEKEIMNVLDEFISENARVGSVEKIIRETKSDIKSIGTKDEKEEEKI